MNLEQFIEKYEGKTVGYPHGSYTGQCLSLAKWYIKEVFGINPPPSGCGAARCYWSKFPNPLGSVFKKVPNTPNLVPQRGWIAIWNKNSGSGYGHIAIVLSADVNQFVSFDQNYYGKHAHKQKHNYNNVSGFLVPITNETMKKYTEKEMSEMREARDENWDKFQAEQEKTDALKDEVKKKDEALQDSRSQLSGAKKKGEQIKNEYTNYRAKVSSTVGSPDDSLPAVLEKLQINQEENERQVKKIKELNKSYKELKERKSDAMESLKTEIQQLQSTNDELDNKLIKQRNRANRLVQRLEQLEAGQTPIEKPKTRFQKAIDFLLSLIQKE